MDANPPTNPEFWRWVGYYLLAIIVGCMGSFAGLLVERRGDEMRVNRRAVFLYLFLGAITGAFTTMLVQDTLGMTPFVLGVIGFASFKAVDVLASLSLAAGAMIERIFGRR